MRGFSVVEVLLSSALFALFVTALTGAYLYGQESSALAGNRARAVMLAEEGLEVARNIRDSGYANLTAGTHGLAISGNIWVLSGSSDTTGIFTRTVTVTSVDADRKDVSCTVSWQQNSVRAGSVTLSTRLTNWQASAVSPTSCQAYAQQLGYATGVCRANAAQCTGTGGDYLPDADALCTGGSNADTCCGVP